jgi:hypothetical protein
MYRKALSSWRRMSICLSDWRSIGSSLSPDPATIQRNRRIRSGRRCG